MNKFKELFEGTSADKGLVKAIAKSMKNYGGPTSGKDPLEQYIKGKAEAWLYNAFREYFKSKEGQKMIDVFIEDAGIELGTPEAEAEREYYEDNFTYGINSIDLENKY